LEKWLIYGINFNYHLEHHLWPHVPFFNLPKLHAHLVERGFYEQRPDLLQRSERVGLQHELTPVGSNARRKLAETGADVLSFLEAEEWRSEQDRTPGVPLPPEPGFQR